jgi:hypothetical protein
MIEKDPNLFDEMYNFFLKIFIPAFIAISIKIATQVKKEKMTFTRVLMSFVVGVGCAYFVYPFVNNEIQNSYIPLIVAIVAISGEKIAEYIIYKFDVDGVLGAIIDALIDRFKNRK